MATKRSPALVTKPARPPDATCSNVFTVTPGKTRLDVARLPICESHLAQNWRRYAAKAPREKDAVTVLQNFIVLNDLVGGVDAELWRWVHAGCPHVCGR